MASASQPTPLSSLKVGILNLLINTCLIEGPWSVAATTVGGEQTETMEYEAKVKGQEWVNHAYKVKFSHLSFYILSHQLWMEHTGKSEKELQAALKEWYTIDESPVTVEQMVEAQNWVVTFFALKKFNHLSA